MDKMLQLRLTTEVDPVSMMELYFDAGWDQRGMKVDFEIVEDIAKNSFRFVGLFDDSQLVGMGRAISDGVSDAYIQDVVVHSRYRGHGWGKKIVKMLLDELRAASIEWIGLVAEPGTEKMYRELGLVPMSGYTAMKFERGTK